LAIRERILGGNARHPRAGLIHGTGAGPALLDAVVDPEEEWVADPNPRAQAFCRKHGFVADGTAQIVDGVREIRMVRGMHLMSG
jgi:hypothetical protein